MNIIDNVHSMIDLGAGDGRVICYASQKFYIKAVGLEIDLELLKTGNAQIQKLKIAPLCTEIESDLYHFQISGFDLIYCFILPISHPAFRHVIEKMKKFAYLISIKWPMSKTETNLKLLEKIQPLAYYPVYIYQKI